MNSPLPKVLHPVGGRPMLTKIVSAVKTAGAKEVRVVVGFGEQAVRTAIEPMGAVCFRQQKQLGTANAVQAAQPESLEGVVLILNGDHPLISTEDIQSFINQFDESGCDLAVVTSELEVPGSYGRIVRKHDKVWAIVEAKDASYETKRIREINTGIYVTRAEVLKQWLPKIRPHNAQGEFYLTDIISLVNENGGSVDGLKSPAHVAEGVNTQIELAAVSVKAFRRTCEKHMAAGVIVVDPSHTYIEDTVRIGAGTVLFPNVYLRGETLIGSMVVIEPSSFVTDSRVADHVVIKAGSYLENATVGEETELGPYARLRPGTVLGRQCKVGNFVETKKITMGDRSKASHLTYLGDAEIGTDTNIGCGTITCNYATDKKKYKTQIGSHVFVGSDTQFVAPVKVGDHAVIGSGSTITKDVPDRALAVARGRQVIKENYNPS